MAGLYIRSSLQDSDGVSMSPMSRIAFTNVSEVQVERLQMFVWMSLGWPVDVIFVFAGIQSTPVIYNLMEAVAREQGTASSKLQPVWGGI